MRWDLIMDEEIIDVVVVAVEEDVVDVAEGMVAVEAEIETNVPSTVEITMLHKISP